MKGSLLAEVQPALPLSEMPRVLNRYRDAIPAGAVDIMRPSIWGNPWSHLPRTRARYRVKTREEAVLAHRMWFLTSDDPEAVELRRRARLPKEQGGLRGADCVCCCAPLPCHGNTYLEYANAPNEDGCRVCAFGAGCRHIEAIRKANDID